MFGPVLDFMSNYIHTFITALWSHESLHLSYILTVIFGYVGGILSLQHRKEMEAEGKDHPFIPISITYHGSPTPISEQEPDLPEVEQEESPQQTEEPAVTKGVFSRPNSS